MSVDPNGTGGPTGAAARPPLPTDPAVLEAAIEARRAHLAATVDELVVRAQPKEIARRGVQSTKVRIRQATRTPDGQLRTERVVAVAGAALAFVLFVVWNRRRISRRE